RYRHLRPVPAPDAESPAGRALRHAGRVRAVPRMGPRARLPGGRVGSAGALELSGGRRVRAYQRRTLVADLAADYALFVAQLITVLGLLLLAAVLLVGLGRRGAPPEGLVVTHLNRQLEQHADVLRRAVE